MSDATPRSYDRVALRYAAEIGGELAGKPLDRALLNAFAESVAGPVLDVGGGPGHVADYLVQRGVAVVSTDISLAMSGLASRAGLPSVAADMTALPFRSDAVGGIVCWYAVIHLDAAQRAAAYASFRRVLRPGGIGLIAFHTRDADTPTGGEVTLSSWWGQPVALTFRFLDPSAEAEALAAAGFELMARLDRTPGPGEHASERSYLMVRRHTEGLG
jgi:SAM-dependent methyltransferase